MARRISCWLTVWCFPVPEVFSHRPPSRAVVRPQVVEHPPYKCGLQPPSSYLISCLLYPASMQAIAKVPGRSCCRIASWWTKTSYETTPIRSGKPCARTPPFRCAIVVLHALISTRLTPLPLESIHTALSPDEKDNPRTAAIPHTSRLSTACNSVEYVLNT